MLAIAVPVMMNRRVKSSRRSRQPQSIRSSRFERAGTGGAGPQGRLPASAFHGGHEVQPSSLFHHWQAELPDLWAHPSGSPRLYYAR
jgi:hypothetical protein